VVSTSGFPPFDKLPERSRTSGPVVEAVDTGKDGGQTTLGEPFCRQFTLSAENNRASNTPRCSSDFHHIFPISPDPFFFFLSFQEYTSILIPLSSHRVLFSRCPNCPMGAECTKFRDVGIVRHLLSPKRVPVHPRNRHLQKPGDFTHGQMPSGVSVSVVHHCGPLLRNAARTKHSARSSRSWAGATPRITLGTETCTKVGSLQPTPVFCPCPNLSSCHAQVLILQIDPYR